MLQASVCCSTPWLAAGASIGKNIWCYRTKQNINNHIFYEFPILHKHAKTIGLLAAYVLSARRKINSCLLCFSFVCSRIDAIKDWVANAG